MRNQFLLTTAMAVASLNATAIAQEETKEEDVITVYGTLSPLPVSDYPGQVTVLDRDDIELITPSSISDILRDVPGVEFSGGPRRTGETPSIRGRGGENVLILLDGARQSFVSAHDGRFFLEPELLKRAEVVRGPASSLYGSGAVGGVLAFETVDAADLLQEGQSVGGQLRLGYQSVNEEFLVSALGYMQQGSIDVVGSIAKRDSGDIELGSGADLPSDDDIVSGLLKLGYEINEEMSFDVSWQRFDNSALEPNNGQGTALSGDPVLGRDVEKDITTDTYRFGGRYAPASTDLVDLALTLYKTETTVEEFDKTVPRATTREIETTGVSLRNIASLVESDSASVSLTVGADWFKDEQVGRDDRATGGVRGGVPNGETEFTGLFAQVEASVEKPLGLPGELLIIPGIRYDEFESEAPAVSPQRNKNDATSARFAVSYNPTENWQFFASYAEGFRAPSINQLYLDGVHFSFPHPILGSRGVFISNNFIPNPNLKPEETETLEIGFGTDHGSLFLDGDRLTTKISYFESDVTDLIDLRVNVALNPTCFRPPFQPCTAGTSTSDNVKEAEINGFEAEAVYTVGPSYTRMTFSSIEGEDKSNGADLGVLTPNRLAIDTRWDFTEALKIGARIQYASDFDRKTFNTRTRQISVTDVRDSYTILDLYGTWHTEFAGGMALTAGIDNVFEEDYERVFAGVSEPGRNFKVNATWKFGQ